MWVGPFWPDVWTTKADGELGHEQPIRPSRAHLTVRKDMTLQWLQSDVSLAEDLIVGPFHFTKQRIPMQGPKRQAISEENRIDDT